MNHDFSGDPVGWDQIFSCAHCGKLVLRFVFGGLCGVTSRAR